MLLYFLPNGLTLAEKRRSVFYRSVSNSFEDESYSGRKNGFKKIEKYVVLKTSLKIIGRGGGIKLSHPLPPPPSSGAPG